MGRRGKCGDESNCFGLHLCPRYLFGKCSNDQNCLYVHDRKSDHNKPIVEAFKMSKMQFDKFRWRVFMINNPEWKRDEPRTADGATSLPLGTKPTFNIKYPVKDEAVHMYNKKPVFQPRNTVNQGPRTPVKPTRPYTEEVMQCPPHMSFDIQPNAGESRVSRIDNGNPQPQSRSKHSSTQRTQRRSGNRCNSVERGVNASTRGRHQCIDHLSSGHVGNHQHNTKIPSADEVFNFMVKNMGGKGTPYDIKTRRRLFPTDFDINDWFRKNKSRFTLIERNETLSYVLVFNKNVTYCFNYKCSKSDCRRYHVCKNMLSGKCEYGRHCKYSHDCFDENNSKISDKLGYSDLFTNEEICSILKVSYPHVCTTWALKGSCRERYCFGLHICPRYIRDKCTNGPNCPQVHDRISDHNKPILDAFEMSDMQYDQFRLRLFMVWNGNEPKTADGTVPVQSDTQQAVRKKNLLKEETDEAGDTYICIRYLQDGCRERRCKFLHTKSKLPYLWQIKLSEKWISLNESEDIEKAFANKLEMSDRIHTTYNGVEYVFLLLFEPNVRARVTAADDEATEKEARRLSTMSYKQLESSLSSDIKQEENKDSLCTQWRWYWKDDNEQLQLYRPDDLQHTLEVKYLAQQKKYIFSRGNYFFNYTISFDLLQQTNNDTGKRRAIRRRPLLVTSADVKENVYQKKTMDANATRLANGKPVSVDQRYLFHGTDGIDAVRGICVNNFDIRVSGKSGTLYGDGAYFAKDSKYSHAYTKGPERYMFLVNVLVGHYTTGNKSYRRPPHKPGSDHELFDSCVNDITDPSIFVVFDKNQYYPEYLIKYHDEGQESVARKAKDKIRLHAAGIAKTIQRFTSDDDDKTSPAVTLQKADDQHDNLFKRLHTSDFRSNANILLSSRGLNAASSDCRWTDLSSSTTSVGTATTEQDRKYFETSLCNTISAGRDCASQTVQSLMKTKDSRQKGIALAHSGSFDKEESKKNDVTERLDFVDRNKQEVRHPSVQTDIFGDRITISQHRSKESELFDAQLHHAYQPPRMKLDPEQYRTYEFAKSLRESDSSRSKMSDPKSPTRSKRYMNQMDD
ncbi:uncharacterized protein LOC123527457 isoform X2 [Mercenaria mercenaria]|uniref:uncharacterized protein LOC123527457 isoform X2 n=1 Tax=Mercenaria mercenaria TaxID=6596 RepID=UPI00234EA64C|nr:uncharacterized protein LOC123527457 isoform X2 [Mercenaria mercenaria]